MEFYCQLNNNIDRLREKSDYYSIMCRALARETLAQE